uniref:Uncharacterized protein n=1 Tax=Tanacetum cinerariifolium TaxID=118510 RepID=A0A699H2D7_TANCI|nr:hypothetical protein [Tanacetum cinerariifolium]
MKYCENEDDSFMNLETEYPAIVFDDTSDAALSCEPTRQFILALGLHTEEKMAKIEVGAYWSVSERVIPDKGGLRDYWMKISSGRDFLGLAPSYVFIGDHVRRLCHRMIACSISGKGQAPKKETGVNLFYFHNMDLGTANVPYLLAQYLFTHAEGRKSEARLSRGHFIGRLAAHFGLVSDQGLRGLLVAAAAGALGAAEDASTAFEGAQAVLEPVQAPQLPPPAPQHRNTSQRIKKIKEEMHKLWQSVVGLRGVVESSITKQTRVFTWMISCMTQLMDANGCTY